MIFGADIITSYKGNIYFAQVKKTINPDKDLSGLMERYEYIHLFIDSSNNVYKNEDLIKLLYKED